MILVTGASGLLGSALVKLLVNSGQRVRAVYNNTPISFTHANLQTVKVDLLDVYAIEEALQGISEVYHCAGYVSFSPADTKKLFKINVEATANLVNAALQADVKKLLHVSSVAALGRVTNGEYTTEKMQWTPDTSNSNYGHSKYLGEMEVWRAVAEGLNAVVINPSIILGAGNWNQGSSKMFKTAFDEFPYYATGTTGFVDVADVVAIMQMLMLSDVTAEKFIVSAANKTYREVFDMMSLAFGKKKASKKVTPLIAALSWRFAKLQSIFTKSSPLITRETATAALANVQFDNSKLLNHFPHFKYRNLQQSIGKICSEVVLVNKSE